MELDNAQTRQREQCSDDPTGPTTLTLSSVHHFSRYEDLEAFIKKHAAGRGFEMRKETAGGRHSTTHGGTFRCWCYKHLPAPVSEEVISSHPPLRTVHAKTSTRGGKQVKCGCQWEVKYCRQADGEYRISQGTRKLTHTGHTLLPPAQLDTNIDSLRNVSSEIEAQVRGMITSGMHCAESERRYLQGQHKVTLDRDLYRNLVKKLKREMGIVDSSADFDGLLQWLQSEQHNRGAVARMRIADDKRVTDVFYMSADMLHHLDRNGQVLCMDTTFKTNRFHWPLLLVVGVDEHFHTVLLAVAILQHQTTDAFEWAFNIMKAAVTEEVWGNIACVCVFTDSDGAMAGAINEILPHAALLRCRYHLETNVRSDLFSLLGVVRMEEFVTNGGLSYQRRRSWAFLQQSDDCTTASRRPSRTSSISPRVISLRH